MVARGQTGGHETTLSSGDRHTSPPIRKISSVVLTTVVLNDTGFLATADTPALIDTHGPLHRLARPLQRLAKGRIAR